MRGTYDVVIRGEIPVGLAMTRGCAIDAFATGLLTGALRLITGREGPLCATGTFVCAAAVSMPNEVVIAAVKQRAKNVDCFIACSADLTSEVSISCALLQTSECLETAN